MPRLRVSSVRGDERSASAWRAGARPVALAEGVIRYRDPRHEHIPLPPFPAYAGTPTSRQAASDELGERPTFRDAGGWRHVRIAIKPGVSLYGTGEQAGALLRNGTRKVCWNTDAFGYDERSPSLYQSHPWVLAVRADGTAYGVILESTWRVVMDLGKCDPLAMVLSCRGPSPGVTVIDGPSVQDVLRKLTDLTGRMALPPLWALGYQQCRWSYEPDGRVRDLAREFRERKLPCDVLWLDIDYMDRFRCFTFDGEKFPEPAKLNAELQGMGFKTVWMIDPGLAADPEYAVYAAGSQGARFVQATSNGTMPTSVVSDELAGRLGISLVEVKEMGDAGRAGLNGHGLARRDYFGRVWPGACAFPDFSQEPVRRWWAGLYAEFVGHGIDGVWNDMNEPAVFDGPGKTMPEDNWHDADTELGGPGAHARYHNIYGMQMVRATRAGIQAANPQKRPFVLTRSNFLGGHRYAATWTGDNTADWTHLRWSISMILNLGLSGQAFAGPDIGGFAKQTPPEMFARWMGIGCLLPFARGHKIKEWDGKPMPDHEPWSFGSEVEATCRRALERRYRLLPHLYSLFEEATRTGAPVCRPVWWADPTDPRLRSEDRAFLIGDDILVVCDTDAPGDPDGGASPMPRGVWRAMRELDEGDPALPRLFQRGGSVVPLGPVVQFAGEKPLDPLTLCVSRDEHGTACGTLYEDAGEGFAYRTGEFRRSEIVVRAGTPHFTRVEGVWAEPARNVRVVVLPDEA